MRWGGFTAYGVLKALGALLITAAVLKGHPPPAEPVVASADEALEPKTWVGKELPPIDITEQSASVNWLILLYRQDCLDRAKAIPRHVQMVRDLAGNDEFPRVAVIDVPPYRQLRPHAGGTCALGRLAEAAEWFDTIATVLVCEGNVNSAWEQSMRAIEGAILRITQSGRRTPEDPASSITVP